MDTPWTDVKQAGEIGKEKYNGRDVIIGVKSLDILDIAMNQRNIASNYDHIMAVME